MSRLPQLLPGQTQVPWYHQNFLLAGIALALIGVALLIPWLSLWRLISPCSIYRRRKEHQSEKQEQEEQRRREQEQQEFLRRTLPTYVIHEPVINPQPVNPKEHKYEANFKITVTNQPDCKEPVLVSFNRVQMTLEQEWGYGRLIMNFMIPPGTGRPNETVPLKETREYLIDVVGYPGNASEPYLDLSQCYHWIIEGIRLDIANLGIPVRCRRDGYINGEEKPIQ